ARGAWAYNRRFRRRNSMPKRNGNGRHSAAVRDRHDARPLLPDGFDLSRIERAVREILIAIGEDPDREGLVRTPNRVARAYGELMAGLSEDPRGHLKTVLTERYDEVVLLRDIEFYSLCEHHLLPFVGKAH